MLPSFGGEALSPFMESTIKSGPERKHLQAWFEERSAP